MPEAPDPKVKPHPWVHARTEAVLPPPSVSSCAAYAELQVTSNFTFLTGASCPAELIHQAGALGLSAIALTDTNTLAGVVRAHVAARQTGVHLVVGCRLRLSQPSGLTILLYPTTRTAYGRLCRLLSLGKQRAPKGQCRLRLHDLIEHNDGLLATVVPPPVIDQDFLEVLEGLGHVFDDDRLSIAASCLYGPDDLERLSHLNALTRHTHIRLVATNDVHYHRPDRRQLQDVLTCIRSGCRLPEAGLRLLANAERHLKPPEEMARLFAGHPEALDRTVEIACRAGEFDLEQLRYEYPDETTPSGKTPMQHMVDLTWQGARERYPDSIPQKVRSQIEHEFTLIDQLNYATYFLTVHDLMAFARRRDILCQGRGAAANSAVCYCLGVTAVDPNRINVLFERFVSKERNEPPDIDIDFEHERREEVIQYIYRKYGRNRAALTAEVVTYRGRSAVREVGKALGLSLDCVDRLAKNIDWWKSSFSDDRTDRLRKLGLNPLDPTIQHLIALVDQIAGFPRHLSQHVGGFVITRTPLCEMVPIENAAMKDRTVIEWDKDDIDAMGMLKVDVLGLGMLTCIHKCFDLVNSRRYEAEASSEFAIQKRRSNVDQDFSGSDCLAEGDATGADNPSSYATDTVRGTGRPNHPDAACDGLHPFQHCRVDNTVRISSDPEDAAARQTPEKPSCRGGPNPPGPDPQSGKSIKKVDPACFSAFVPSCLSLHTIPPEDPAVYDMICSADTIGVFQIESRAQMSMLPRLRPRCYYDLVIEVAIVRPGPIQGDMVHPYLRRRNGSEPVTYPSESVRRVLCRTLGVPLFQEQVMELAIVAAGFTPGESDQLRRAIAAWKSRSPSGILQLRDRLVDGMRQRGYELDFANRCFEQIKGFGDYGFPESHAASFALLVYASAWLKCHYPAAFAAALLNSQPMGFYASAQIVRDAREHGVEVRPVDINHSQWDCTLETDSQGADALRLGTRLVRGLRQADAEMIMVAVTRNGQFQSIASLQGSVKVTALRRLAGADAFGSMGLSRQAALWAIRNLRDEALPIFDQTADTADSPDAPDADRVHLPVISESQKVWQDYHAVGLSLKAHPFSFIRDRLDARHVTPNDQLKDEAHWPNNTPITVAGLVLVRQQPGTASGVVFMTLEDETDIANLIVRPHIFKRYRKAARHSHAILVEGQVERRDQVVHVMVRRITDIDHEMAELTTRSRDFH